MQRSQRLVALAKSGGGFLGCATAALVLAELGLVRWGLYCLLAAAVLALGTYLWQAVVRASRAGVQAVEVAAVRLAEQLAPELGTAPSSALDFSHRLEAAGDVPFSRDLAQHHVERTAVALSDVDLTARWREREHRHQQRRWLLLGICGGLAVVAITTLSQGRRRLFGMIVNPTASQLVDTPLAADIRITYHYPTYTGLPERTVEGGDGSVAAVVGTEVELHANADEAVHSAMFKLDPEVAGGTAIAVPMIVNGRDMRTSFPVQRDARYHFSLTTRRGEKLEERRSHTIRAIADAPPEIAMLAPAADVELRDNQTITIAYAAKDDFSVAKIELVVEVVGSKDPKRLPIAANSELTPKKEGTYGWHVAELALTPGAEARFYLEATDNNAIAGPQRGVSAAHRLVLFSAQKHHDELMARQQHVLDALVDWLGAELDTPQVSAPPETDKNATAQQSIAPQQNLLETVRRLSTELSSLLPLIRGDTLADAGIVTAFGNIREHVQRAERERSQLVGRLASGPGSGRSALLQALNRERRRDIGELEKDIIYLDDLLAIERIDQLKGNAKDLLAAQRHLQKLLSQYKQTQDPALREELSRRIRELKEQMLGLLARMAEIKQQLPGEYRNLESASQLAVGDELERIEKALNQGDLDSAARELEQLAGMIENMSDRLGNAEKRFGDERYSEVRKQLAEFASQFEALENDQQNLAKRSDELAKQLRDKTLERVGSKLDDFVRKARDKTNQAQKQLDQVQLPPQGLFGVAQPLQQSRDRLLDLDGLLTQKDFAVALRMAEEAQRHEEELKNSLDARSARYGQSAPEMKRASDASARALRLTREVADLLGKLFPDADQVLGKEQIERMRSIGRKQAELEGKAGKLAERMNELAEQVPLFGGEPRASLDNARGEMSQATRDLGTGELPGGALHERQAASELGKLRQALEQASKSGKGGLPLPLAMGNQQGRGEQQGSDGPNGTRNNEDVHIPDADKNRAAPQFRKELLEAAKQKAPQRYEDAVRRYYEELIR